MPDIEKMRTILGLKRMWLCQYFQECIHRILCFTGFSDSHRVTTTKFRVSVWPELVQGTRKNAFLHNLL